MEAAHACVAKVVVKQWLVGVARAPCSRPQPINGVRTDGHHAIDARRPERLPQPLHVGHREEVRVEADAAALGEVGGAGKPARWCMLLDENP